MSLSGQPWSGPLPARSADGSAGREPALPPQTRRQLVGLPRTQAAFHRLRPGRAERRGTVAVEVFDLLGVQLAGQASLIAGGPGKRRPRSRRQRLPRGIERLARSGAGCGPRSRSAPHGRRGPPSPRPGCASRRVPIARPPRCSGNRRSMSAWLPAKKRWLASVCGSRSIPPLPGAMLVSVPVGAMWQVWHCLPSRRAGLSSHSEYVL